MRTADHATAPYFAGLFLFASALPPFDPHN